MPATILDFELELARRLKPARFGGLAWSDDGKLQLDVTGDFTPAAIRILCKHLLERCDAIEAEGRR